MVGAYCGLVKQVIYMEENIEKIGLGKGSRKNGSTTTNHIDNIGMSVYKNVTEWPKNCSYL